MTTTTTEKPAKEEITEKGLSRVGSLLDAISPDQDWWREIPSPTLGLGANWWLGEAADLLEVAARMLRHDGAEAMLNALADQEDVSGLVLTADILAELRYSEEVPSFGNALLDHILKNEKDPVLRECMLNCAAELVDSAAVLIGFIHRFGNSTAGLRMLQEAHETIRNVRASDGKW